jgi:hypothetical protein
MGGALYWREIMDPEMLLKPIMPRIGALCIWIGALGGLIVGFLLSTGLYHGQLFHFAKGTTGPRTSFSNRLFYVPHIVLKLYGEINFSVENSVAPSL